GPMCCVECFNHEWLRDHVREASAHKGDCHYCGAEDVAVVDVALLYGPFDNLLRLYAASDDCLGDFLIDLIQGGHEVFNEELYEDGEADQLLDDIMGSGWDDDQGPRVWARDMYERTSSQWMTEAWRNFCEKVKVDPEHE